MNYTNEEAYNVGKKQKAILWLILATLLAFLILVIFPFAILIVSIIGIVFVYQLASALKSSYAWLWALLQLIPLVSLICLIILNQKATKVLRDKSVGVGLMGANSKELENLIKK